MDSNATRELQEAFEKATDKFSLCPNRVWSVAGEDLPKLMPDSDLILAQDKSEEQNQEKSEEHDQDKSKAFKSHELCTFDFCEHSQRDFTGVPQRHECETPKTCLRLKGLFSRRMLTRAAEDDRATVWSLDGRSMIKPPQPYMAISHVWSDGTGTGAWQKGEVNECMYSFFRRIAQQFQCDGIWWDTICIPREKAARNKAIQRIQVNYENARITLVHDLFLRNCEWNEKTACFAILMSPWFSRGWTALELAKSRKVKVIFKGPYGLLIKDLDEEILAQEDEHNGPRREATQIIKKLRSGINTLNDLLTTLGPRYTSWPRDRAIISGLLTDSELTNNPQNEIRQQDIYRAIMVKMGEISQGHLFHNSATTFKLSWCPTSLFDIPVTTDPTPSLRVTEALDLKGKWRGIPATNMQAREEKYCWRGTHPLIKQKIQLYLKDPEKADCFFLFECQPTSGSEPSTGLERALLVKRTSEPPCYQYIGAVYFHPALDETDLGGNVDEMEVTLLGGARKHDESASKGKKVQHAQTCDDSREGPDLLDAIWRGDRKRFSEYAQVDLEGLGQQPLHLAAEREDQWKVSKLLEKPDGLGQQPLHLAAERGDKWMVLTILEKANELGKMETILAAKCNIQQTALHRAAWGGSEAVVKLLKDKINRDIPDKDGNSALHIAAEKGFEHVVKLIIDKSDCNLKNHDKLSPLHCAVRNETGQLGLVQLLLDNGAGINAEDKYGRTPLHYAIETQQSELVQLFIENRANIKAEDKYGWTPLHYAVEARQQETVELLLEMGADVNAKDGKVGWTPLHFAAINGHLGLVERLVKLAKASEADNYGWTPWWFAELKKHWAVAELLPGEDSSTKFNYLDENCWTPLHCAAISERQGLIKLFLNGEVDVDFKFENDQPALSWASKNGQGAVLQLLLDGGADIEAKAHLGKDVHYYPQYFIPLGEAAANGQEGVVQLLLDRAAKMILKNGGGSYPLFLAAENGHEGIVQLLLDRGANINPTGNEYRSPLYIAAEKGYEGIVQLLLDRGANINPTGKVYSTPLSMAAKNGHEGIVQLLLDRGANINPTGNDYSTPLYNAAENGYGGTVQLLLDRGTDINQMDRYKSTSLLVAAEKGYEGVVQLLLDKGADINSKNQYGHTPFSVAAWKGREGVIQLILDKGADINSKDEYSQTPLSVAAEFGHKGVVQLLLDKGADINSKDKGACTPLSVAAKHGHKRVVQLLLDKGADINSKDQSGRTPLSLAAREGERDVVRLLLDRGAGVNSKDESGCTPLSLAAEKGKLDVV